MASRHALLIGVPRYDDEEFNDERLEPVEIPDLVDQVVRVVGKGIVTDAALDRLQQAGAVVVTCPRSNEGVGGGIPRRSRGYALAPPRQTRTVRKRPSASNA